MKHIRFQNQCPPADAVVRVVYCTYVRIAYSHYICLRKKSNLGIDAVVCRIIITRYYNGIISNGYDMFSKAFVCTQTYLSWKSKTIRHFRASSIYKNSNNACWHWNTTRNVSHDDINITCSTKINSNKYKNEKNIPRGYIHMPKKNRYGKDFFVRVSNQTPRSKKKARQGHFRRFMILYIHTRRHRDRPASTSYIMQCLPIYRTCCTDL